MKTCGTCGREFVRDVPAVEIHDNPDLWCGGCGDSLRHHLGDRTLEGLAPAGRWARFLRWLRT